MPACEIAQPRFGFFTCKLFQSAGFFLPYRVHIFGSPWNLSYLPWSCHRSSTSWKTPVAPTACIVPMSPPDKFVGSRPSKYASPESMNSCPRPYGRSPMSSYVCTSLMVKASCVSRTSKSSTGSLMPAMLYARYAAIRAARNELNPGHSCRRPWKYSLYVASVSFGSSRIGMFRRSAVRSVCDPPQIAASRTGLSVSLCAVSSSARISTAAPTLITQHSRNVSGSDTISFFSTSSTVYLPGFCANGE